MKDFGKIIKETLNLREELEKKQKELAEEIVEVAIKAFSDIDEDEVHILLDGKNKKIVVQPQSLDETTFKNLIYPNYVYELIKEILCSDTECGEYFTVQVDAINGNTLEIYLK